MFLPQISLATRIPAVGSEFKVGVNCAALELTAEWLLIRSPLTEGYGDPCSFDILVSPMGWSKIPHGATNSLPEALASPSPGPRFACPHCSQGFMNAQGLGSHVTRKHPKE